MNNLSGSIIRTLAYFDMFSYPLLAEEIFLFLDERIDKDDLQPVLHLLEKEKRVFKTQDFYSLRKDPAMIGRRIKGNERAATLLQTAKRIARILYRFPFVRGVGISGSLSKNFADEDSDIDFFIITRSDRLWIARTLMHLLKKFSFLAGRQHWFCMNYYISESSLVIHEKNIFTATEVVTLVPVCGEEGFHQFFSANNWAGEFFPNQTASKSVTDFEKKNRLKSWLENSIPSALAQRLDIYWMNLTAKRWRAKENYHRLNTKGEPLGLKTGRQFARPAPGNFQQKILDRYEKKLESLKEINPIVVTCR